MSTTHTEASSDNRSIVLLKFGGTSVRSAAKWATIATVAQSRLAEGHHPVLVCSAIGGTSDHLEALLASVDDPEASERIVQELRADHWRLAEELDVDAEGLLGEAFDHLSRLVESIRVLGEIPPRTRAQIMSIGELLSTRLGAAWMKKAGLPVAWQDARKWLASEPQDEPGLHYLSAVCPHEESSELREEVLSSHRILVTQGFIARDEEGDTVLLGRGGSDTSAAYLASMLGAIRLEIWTDVPGLFTTNPRDVSTARRLQEVSWAEAEALATLGASVLHPRCIGPVREAGIPLHVRYTGRSELPGTRVDAIADTPAIRAVAVRKNLHLITMNRPPAWQEVGFLADVTACFQRHGLSIDLLSTSPGRVQVTVDPAAAPHAADRLFGIDKNAFARANVTLLITQHVHRNHVERRYRTINPIQPRTPERG